MMSDVGVEEVIGKVSQQFGVSVEAVEAALEALRRGNGTMAQFSHPDFGGMAQWSSGGMSMVGDMFNSDTKRRFDGVMSALSKDFNKLNAPTSSAGVETHERNRSGASHSRWPSDWGRAGAVGSQNDMHYAFFPDVKRLGIERNGQKTLYDTGEHVISGVSQQQGFSQDIRFQSQLGPVLLSDLKIVEQ